MDVSSGLEIPEDLSHRSIWILCEAELTLLLVRVFHLSLMSTVTARSLAEETRLRVKSSN